MRKNRGQSVLEYTVLTVCIVAALWMMQNYVKRSIGGKVKASSDQIGEPYDPATTVGVAYSNVTSNVSITSKSVGISEVHDAYGRDVVGVEMTSNQNTEFRRNRHEQINSE